MLGKKKQRDHSCASNHAAKDAQNDDHLLGEDRLWRDDGSVRGVEALSCEALQPKKRDERGKLFLEKCACPVDVAAESRRRHHLVDDLCHKVRAPTRARAFSFGAHNRFGPIVLISDLAEGELAAEHHGWTRLPVVHDDRRVSDARRGEVCELWRRKAVPQRHAGVRLQQHRKLWRGDVAEVVLVGENVNRPVARGVGARIVQIVLRAARLVAHADAAVRPRPRRRAAARAHKPRNLAQRARAVLRLCPVSRPISVVAVQ